MQTVSGQEGRQAGGEALVGRMGASAGSSLLLHHIHSFGVTETARWCLGGVRPQKGMNMPAVDTPAVPLSTVLQGLDWQEVLKITASEWCSGLATCCPSCANTAVLLRWFDREHGMTKELFPMRREADLPRVSDLSSNSYVVSGVVASCIPGHCHQMLQSLRVLHESIQ